MGGEDPISAWLRGGDDEEPPPGPRRSPRRVWVLAGVPWVAVAGLLLVLAGGVERTLTSAPDVSPSTDASDAASPLLFDEPDPTAPPDPVQPVPAQTPDPDELSAEEPGVGAGDIDGLDPALAAVAIATVRESLRGADAAGVQRMADQLVVDAVDAREGHVLVGVVAVLLEGGGDGWHATRTVRHAVPVAGAGPAARALAAPWPLPALAAEPAPPLWQEPEAPPDAAALGAALVEAGWEATQVEGVRAAPSLGVLEVRLRGLPPGGDAAADHVVWVDASDLTVLDPATAHSADARPQDAVPPSIEQQGSP